MDLEDFLKAHKNSILPRWLDSLFEVYPPGSHEFLRKKKDRFANPVGYSLTVELERLYDEIASQASEKEIEQTLDSIMRIRAVQDLRPSEAVRFILDLKKIVNEELRSSTGGQDSGLAVRDFDQKMDSMCLEGFDIYSKCRQKIFDIRVNEVKRQVSRLMERANLVCDIPDTVEDL